MTAAQLIERLSELPPETEVYIWSTYVNRWYPETDTYLEEVTDVETEPVRGRTVLS